MARYIFILQLLLSVGAYGQYDSLISKWSQANEIILDDSTVFEVYDMNKSVLSRKYKAIILNGAAQTRRISLYYDDFREIKHALIEIKSLNGNVLETIRLKDMDDYSNKSFSLASDNRRKYYRAGRGNYPYVIEVSYAIEYKGSLHYPRWVPQWEEQAVVNASLTVLSYSPNSFRYKELNTSGHKLNELGSVKWKVENLAPFMYESYSHSISDYAPVVYTAPNPFQMNNQVGDMSSWESFGKWIKGLNQSQGDLSTEGLDDLRKLVDQAPNKEEKVRIVYDYLQNNTRYVSVQLGIGGWQPFSASYVQEKKYGDCKALSFYTKSLLNEFGIESFYTLIGAGAYNSRVDKDFPASNFNHAILTVPNDQDTIWLECTSQTNPFGYLGTFTSDRYALLIDDEGGKIIKTKSYSAEENKVVNKVEVKLAEDNSATVNLTKEYIGLGIENDRFRRVVRESDEKKEEWFYDNSSWKDFSIEQLTMSQPTDSIVPKAAYEATIQVNKYGNKRGNRLLLKPFLQTESDLEQLKSTRKTQFEFRYAFSQQDSVIINLDRNYRVEKAVSTISESNKFGEYKSELIQLSSSKLLFVRSLTINKGVYDVSEYEQLRSFVDMIKKQDNALLVLNDKT